LGIGKNFLGRFSFSFFLAPVKVYFGFPIFPSRFPKEKKFFRIE